MSYHDCSKWKVTVKDMTKLPKIISKLKKRKEKLEKGIKVSKEFYKKYNNEDYEIDGICYIYSGIYESENRLKILDKQINCDHTIYDFKWVGEGHDSHKDYYSCRCNKCGLELDSCSI